MFPEKLWVRAIVEMPGSQAEQTGQFLITAQGSQETSLILAKSLCL